MELMNRKVIPGSPPPVLLLRWTSRYPHGLVPAVREVLWYQPGVKLSNSTERDKYVSRLAWGQIGSRERNVSLLFWALIVSWLITSANGSFPQLNRRPKLHTSQCVMSVWLENWYSLHLLMIINRDWPRFWNIYERISCSLIILWSIHIQQRFRLKLPIAQ
jgi:hypothetical protein